MAYKIFGIDYERKGQNQITMRQEEYVGAAKNFPERCDAA